MCFSGLFNVSFNLSALFIVYSFLLLLLFSFNYHIQDKGNKEFQLYLLMSNVFSLHSFQ